MNVLIPPLDSVTPVVTPPHGGIGVHGDDRAAVPPDAAMTAKATPDAIRAAAAAVNDALASRSRAVEFAVDDATGTVVVTLVDTESRKVLRQVPSQELLAIAQSIDRQRNLLLNNKA